MGIDRTLQAVRIDEALSKGDFFGAGDLQALPLLEHASELARFEHAFRCAGVEPRNSSAHQLDGKLTFLEIGAIDIGDLEFAACARAQASCNVHDLLVIEIETRYSPVR